MITVSRRLLSLLGGLLTGGGLRLLEGLRLLDLSRVLMTSMTSEWLEGARRDECEWRRTVTFSSTTDDTGAAPPMVKQVYMSQRMRRKPATEPNTMPATAPGEGPVFKPE